MELAIEYRKKSQALTEGSNYTGTLRELTKELQRMVRQVILTRFLIKEV